MLLKALVAPKHKYRSELYEQVIRAWLMLTDVLEEPEQAIPDPDALEVLKETDLMAYLDHVPPMSPEW